MLELRARQRHLLVHLVDVPVRGRITRRLDRREVRLVRHLVPDLLVDLSVEVLEARHLVRGQRREIAALRGGALGNGGEIRFIG